MGVIFSDMYRNCPEHPIISKILKDGELKSSEKYRIKCKIYLNYNAVLQDEEIINISDDDFYEICNKRLVKNRKSIINQIHSDGGIE